MLKIKVKISETKYCSFYKTLTRIVFVVVKVKSKRIREMSATRLKLYFLACGARNWDSKNES